MLEREVLNRGEDAIRACLDRVPFLKIRDIKIEPLMQGRRPDYIALIERTAPDRTPGNRPVEGLQPAASESISRVSCPVYR